MNREDLEHIIRASGEVTDQYEFIIVGSQSILGSIPNPDPVFKMSAEVDIYPYKAPELADKIDVFIGEGSQFHETNGYYAQGVGPETAILPSGWISRVHRVQNGNTNDRVGYCLDVLDLRALGRLRFNTGHFADSAKALSEEVSQRPTYPYAPIWLYLAQARAGDETAARAQMQARRAAYASDAWPTQVMDYYAGAIDADTLFAAAREAQLLKPAGQRCEANFYAGELQLLRGDLATAQRLLKAAQEDCPRDFDELPAAIAELARLDTR